jgi:hypothetical protein
LATLSELKYIAYFCGGPLDGKRVAVEEPKPTIYVPVLRDTAIEIVPFSHQVSKLETITYELARGIQWDVTHVGLIYDCDPDFACF